MPYRPPLIAHEYFVADPPELPVRVRGEAGPATLTAAEAVASGGASVTLRPRPPPARRWWPRWAWRARG
ncbi:hypothetical protein HDA43_002116 [Streptosporangium sandarakinum]|uniref:Uncharacterized protein n=1 Tax=Streptosporangium sandarakinum TaxID=1260955 RepID=A0A852UQZ8_9ACTN|nr:hypothetical protein [Streptosporangium sandarakinum]